MTSSEVLAAPPSNLEVLQNGREFAAAQASAEELRRQFRPRLDEEHSFSVARVRRNSFPYDEGLVSAGTLLSMEALGVDTQELLTRTGWHSGSENEIVLSITLGGETLGVRRYGRGVSFILDSDGTDPGLKSQEPSRSIGDRVRERLMKSPGHQAIIAARSKYLSTQEVPETVETEPFNYLEDPLGTLIFLNDCGLIYGGQEVEKMRAGMPADQVILTELESSSAVRRQMQDGKIAYVWGERGVCRELEVDEQGGAFVFRVSQRPIDFYLEKANQSNTQSLPFVESECAKDLAGVLDRAGLMFCPDLQTAMMVDASGADRYGSIYTQLSREIAKWVNNPRRTRLSNLFVPIDCEAMGSKLLIDNEPAGNRQPELREDPEAQVRGVYISVEKHVEGEAAAALFGLIDDVLAREDGAEQGVLSDLAVTREAVSMTSGACFDVAYYYVGAAADAAKHPDYLQNKQEDGVAMLEKNTGAHTFLTIEPIIFNGVRLPKGALFTKAKDGKWAFLRLTPFTFDRAQDQLAFGSEISKLYADQRGELERIGELSMLALVAYAT